MGGLFTRRMLGSNNSLTLTDPTTNQSFQILINKVIMLATPHYGSPVADEAVDNSGNVFLIGKEILGGGYWDSTKNLRRDYMKILNAAIGDWPAIPLYLFSASGGPSTTNPNLNGGNFVIRYLKNDLLGADEKINDAVVTKASANGFYQALNTSWPFLLENHRIVSIDAIQSVTDSDLAGKPLDHFNLLDDPKVATWVVNTLLNTSAIPTTYATHPVAKTERAVRLDVGGSPQPAIPMQHYESLSGALTNGATVTARVASDASTSVTFQLIASDTNIVFRLNNPSGGSIDTNSPQVQYSVTTAASNLVLATYTIANPTGGMWTAVIDASSMTATQAAYSLMVYGDSYVGLIPQTGTFFGQGQDAVVSSLFADLTTNPVVAVSNASITANLRLPDGSTNNLTLYDGGWNNDGAPNDGVYAAVLTNVQQAGTYAVTYRATGTNAHGQAIQRVATSSFSVSSGNGSVLGDPSYETVDTDGDGYAEFLSVKVWVKPTVTGNYILAGQLVDASELHKYAKSAQFSADGTGAIQVALIFDLADIRAAGLSGDYHIENLQLFEQTATGTAWLDAYRGT